MFLSDDTIFKQIQVLTLHNLGFVICTCVTISYVLQNARFLENPVGQELELCHKKTELPSPFIC